MKVRFLGRSARQAQSIDAWWRTYRESAPDLFAKELEAAIRLLAKVPEIGVPYLGHLGTHRLLLQRTRYHLYYVIRRDEGVVGVLAIWSCKRGRAPSLSLVDEEDERD